jgi:hypothetical protein
MKIKMVVGVSEGIYTRYQVEIDTDDYDELKNLPVDEVRELIEDGEVELEEGEDLFTFVSEITFRESEKVIIIKNKEDLDIDIEEFEEI